MIDPKELANAFARNVMIVNQQAEGLTHEESLLQLPFRGNCLNWVVGHMAVNRDRVLETLGEPPVMDAAGQRYKRESEPLAENDAGILPLTELLSRLRQAQDRIAEALGRMDYADMSREVEVGSSSRKMTIGQRTFFLYFHETYHVGQTELLRQLAGKDDKVI